MNVIIPQPNAKRGAFTLIELLVAAAVSMLLIVTLLSATMGISTNYSRTQGTITRQGDASLALDQLAQDIEGMVVPNFSQGEGLRIEPDAVPGRTNVWLTLLTTATDRDDSFTNVDFTGAKRAVSYRVSLQNPFDPTRTTDQSYALYRSIASARHTFENVTASVTNAQAQYWNSLSASPAPAPLAPTHEDAFLAENVVGFDVLFEYENASGGSEWTAPGDRIRIGRDGATRNGAGVSGGFRRARIIITTLSPEGAQRVRDGIFPLDQAIERFGKTSVRETSRL